MIKIEPCCIDIHEYEIDLRKIPENCSAPQKVECQWKCVTLYKMEVQYVS